jgi:hypothetical protein
LILIGETSPNSTDFGSRSGQIVAWQDPELFPGVTPSGPESESNKVPLSLPYGVTDVNAPASVAFYDGRSYIVGGYSANIMIDEAYTCWRQGILPPTEAPSVAGGSGGAAVAYWSFYDEVSGERSSLSGGISSFGSGTRTWTNIPLRPPDDVYIPDGTMYADFSELKFRTEDPRTRHFYLRPGDLVTIAGAQLRVTEVPGSRWLSAEPFNYGSDSNNQTYEAYPLTRATHVELWLEEAGDFPRLIARVVLGTQEFIESSTLATRGEAFQDSFQRFPYCKVNAIYHDRQVLAGNPDAPDTVYVSDLFLPERYTGLNFRTRNGEEVVALLSTRDYCLVLTDKSSYILQGYTDSDFTFTVADPNIGAITHVGNIVIHGYPYVWTQEGPYLYTGSWHPMSPENRHYFRDNGPTEFDRATHDPVWNCWITGGRFIVDYTPVVPQAGGGFGPARVSLDEYDISLPDPWQAVGVDTHTAAFMKQQAGDRYGNMYVIHKKQNKNADKTSEPPAGSDRIVTRMDRQADAVPNEWWEIQGD